MNSHHCDYKPYTEFFRIFEIRSRNCQFGVSLSHSDKDYNLVDSLFLRVCFYFRCITKNQEKMKHHFWYKFCFRCMAFDGDKILPTI